MHCRLTIYQNGPDNAQGLVRAIRGMGIKFSDPMNCAVSPSKSP